MTDYTPHRFNPLVAEVYSIPAALIFQFVSFCCDTQKVKFIPLTVDTLCKQYPYLTRITVWNALQKLIHPGKRTPALLARKKIDKVYLYGPIAPDEKFALHSFDVCVALEHGVVPAIILHNVGHWVKMNWKAKAEEAMNRLKRRDYEDDFDALLADALVFTANAAAHTSTIEEWVARHRYVSYRTAVRGFSCLQRAGLLTYRRGQKAKPVWGLALNLRVDYAEKLLKISAVANLDAKFECLDAKSECLDAKSERNLPTSPAGSKSYRAYDEAPIDEAVNTQHGDGFALSLAGARSVARSASYVATAAPSELSELNRPTYKRARAVRKTEPRRYVRQPQPGTEEYDVWFDDLTPVERRKYLAGS